MCKLIYKFVCKHVPVLTGKVRKQVSKKLLLQMNKNYHEITDFQYKLVIMGNIVS